jgi:lipoic acid synthetase
MSERIPKPEWLKIQGRRTDEFRDLRLALKDRGLATVCVEANCPNLTECWSQKTATIMILGDTCTRGCRFCNVKTGNPRGHLDVKEILHTVEMVGLMGLNYVVLTSVDRDDLADHGAAHFASVVRAVHHAHPHTKVEALVPDFGGDPDRMRTLAASRPYVVAQNLETVRRLTHPVRDVRAGYALTLGCLEFYKQQGLMTKTSLMVGLGETKDELAETLDDLRAVGCDIVTFGQYLQPTVHHLPVERYYSPAEFLELKHLAYKKGFRFVASGPLVRSSYRAADFDAAQPLEAVHG